MEMRRPQPKTLAITLLALFLTILSLIVINRYVFSWAGLILSRVGLCEYKTVGVPPPNGYNQKLSQSYDIPQITAAMRLNPNYRVNDHFNGNGLFLSRTIEGVRYNVIFENHNGMSEFNLNTYDLDGGYYPNGLATGGASCTTPSYAIERNVFRIIDDLPLNESQRAELKKNVIVHNAIDLKLIFLSVL